ncbi:peptide-methionine (S)-S-oxide reductase [Paenibacillus campi]|uniref:peptide-methionine (S)-S-oxide reductase n=1 Tax=Paenibacillus campi TaxID=3106031 RepID=UPI002AFDE76A|nr:peptide-methionine (S)-S-oxide reductase [Paenibacillus sp. SGZ-1014]
MANEIILGLGCFWGPEAWIGAMPGVVYTTAGLAGGASGQPTYRQPGDHSETVQIVYDETVLPLERLLEQFWRRHRPAAINGYREERRYRSLILCQHTEQLEHALELQKVDDERAETMIRLDQTFYPVEGRHQKYYLQRQPDVLEQLVDGDNSWVAALGTTLAARLNGWCRKETTLEHIHQELDRWCEPLPLAVRQRYERLLAELE